MCTGQKRRVWHQTKQKICCFQVSKWLLWKWGTLDTGIFLCVSELGEDNHWDTMMLLLGCFLLCQRKCLFVAPDTWIIHETFHESTGQLCNHSLFYSKNHSEISSLKLECVCKRGSPWVPCKLASSSTSCRAFYPTFTCLPLLMVVYSLAMGRGHLWPWLCRLILLVL